MNSYYTSPSPLARRATVPIPVAPTAPMIDPSLDHFPTMESLHQSQQQQSQQQQQPQAQLMRNPVAPTRQAQSQNPMQNSNQLQSPMKANGRINSPSHRFPTQRIQTNPQASTERFLPPQKVTDQTIDDAYVQFIMYCNPNISADTETTELRKGFRSPPKSDGKSFSPFNLFTLIGKLETKDGISTWTQLVLELGVEPPDQEKGQSSQKVQQYAVRLKRWLHAFHVDAFYSYLLSRSSPYQTDRPIPTDPVADVVRDGIPPEEDLAIRALLPEWRPKRGRRKAEDIEAEAEAEANAKRQNTGSAGTEFTSMFEDQYSAAPSSAIPWSAQGTTGDAWTAAQVAIAPKTPSSTQTPTNNQLSAHRANSQMSWRYNNTNETPSTPYPQSAVTPRQDFSASPKFDEPKSAHPSTTSKSPSRARKRHAPAVSSAWPSSSSSTGKIRGRPPSNRSVQDGPFSTFPANPTSSTRDNAAGVGGTPTSNTANASPAPDSQPPSANQAHLTASPPVINQPTNVNLGGVLHQGQHPQNQSQQLNPINVARKPSKLQLQVPAHSGGPVRLATPPRVLINGESNNQVMGRSASSSSNNTNHERRSSNDFFTQLDEIFEEAPSHGAHTSSGSTGGVGALDDGGGGGADEDEGTREDWRRRALMLRRRLAEKEEELRAMKRRVLDAVM